MSGETSESSADRDARRQALRAKIRTQRQRRTGGGACVADGSGGSASAAASMLAGLRQDPKAALLQMGIDDPTILGNAGDIVTSAMQLARGKVGAGGAGSAGGAPDIAQALAALAPKDDENKERVVERPGKEDPDQEHVDESDEEEAPPPS